jgi:hypothetical protein
MALLDCGHEPSKHESCTTGYGTDDKGKTFCYACCAERDKTQMVKDGKTTLYLTHVPYLHRFGGFVQGKVTNWPGSLTFMCGVKQGRHNIASTRYDVWFSDHTGAQWHGVQYGEWTEICHCKRLAG